MTTPIEHATVWLNASDKLEEISNMMKSRDLEVGFHVASSLALHIAAEYQSLAKEQEEQDG